MSRTNHKSLLEQRKDWSKVLSHDEFEELKRALAKYGVEVVVEQNS